MFRSGWLAAALLAAGVGWGCDARNLETMPDAGAPGADARPLTTEYRWGDVSVHVAPTNAPSLGMTLWISDKNNPAALLTTQMFGGDAQLLSYHRCGGDPTLYGVEIYSCAQTLMGGTTTPGCLYASLDKTLGVTGNFVQPTGARCDIQSGSADITLPDPGWSTAGTPGSATGWFVFQCHASDGTELQLDAVFVLRQIAYFLAC
jgi:hypothetical protein